MIRKDRLSEELKGLDQTAPEKDCDNESEMVRRYGDQGTTRVV